MLLNKDGVEVQVPAIYKQAVREAVLAPLREVLVPETQKCGKMFSLEARAEVRNG